MQWQASTSSIRPSFTDVDKENGGKRRWGWPGGGAGRRPMLADGMAERGCGDFLTDVGARELEAVPGSRTRARDRCPKRLQDGENPGDRGHRGSLGRNPVFCACCAFYNIASLGRCTILVGIGWNPSLLWFAQRTDEEKQDPGTPGSSSRTQPYGIRLNQGAVAHLLETGRRSPADPTGSDCGGLSWPGGAVRGCRAGWRAKSSNTESRLGSLDSHV